MALEPITRQEKIIAGQDLTPITRMEKFLKNFGGSGGGGGGAQPDLSQTDTTKPDYVKGVIRQESLPEGYPYKEMATILDGTFEFVYSADSKLYVCMNNDENFTIVDGRSYTVIWDGATYQCVATTFNRLPVLGNLAFGDYGADTGEPFLFCMIGMDMMVYTPDTAATHTITVRFEIVYPIASEFLPALTSPNGTKYQLTVADDGTLSAVQV